MEEADYRTTFELEDHNWWFVGMRRMSLDLLHRHLAPDLRGGLVLDVGCGTGIMLETLERGGPAVGADLSATALGFCRERGRERLAQARGEALPFASRSFSAVTAFGVIEHIDDDRGALLEWARVLRPGGCLVLLTSAYQWLWSGHDVSNHHVRRYVRADIERLLRDAGLQPATVSYANTALFPGIAAVRAVERLRRGEKRPEPRKDTAEVPASLNRLLTGVLTLEGKVIRRRRLPFGVSIIAAATRP